MNQCLHCGAETKNPKFCSQSCATSYNNLHRSKKAFYCSKCGELLGYGYKEFGRKKCCDNCNANIIDWSTVTYGEVKEKRQYQVNSRIRDLARQVYEKSNKPKQCNNCGYDKHYEVCHIKGISEHSDDTLITTINDIHNLIGLCPNCHWEMDNGLLECKDEWK